MKKLSALFALALILGGASSANPYFNFTAGVSDASVTYIATPSAFLDVMNNSATATVCINFNATATITGTVCAAGEITLPPLWHRSWENSYVPNGTMHLISSAASTPTTIGSY